MAKRSAEEEVWDDDVVTMTLEGEKVIVKEMINKEDGGDQPESHPYAFHVSGPRNVSSPNWRDLINSSWSVPTPPFSDLFLKF